MKPPIKFTNTDDETRFTVGDPIWTPDGVNFYRGHPPPAPKDSPHVTVTDVDHRTGTITVK